MDLLHHATDVMRPMGISVMWVGGTKDLVALSPREARLEARNIKAMVRRAFRQVGEEVDFHKEPYPTNYSGFDFAVPFRIKDGET